MCVGKSAKLQEGEEDEEEEEPPREEDNSTPQHNKLLQQKFVKQCRNTRDLAEKKIILLFLCIVVCFLVVLHSSSFRKNLKQLQSPGATPAAKLQVFFLPIILS